MNSPQKIFPNVTNFSIFFPSPTAPPSMLWVFTRSARFSRQWIVQKSAQYGRMFSFCTLEICIHSLNVNARRHHHETETSSTTEKRLFFLLTRNMFNWFFVQFLAFVFTFCYVQSMEENQNVKCDEDYLLEIKRKVKEVSKWQESFFLFLVGFREFFHGTTNFRGKFTVGKVLFSDLHEIFIEIVSNLREL